MKKILAILLTLVLVMGFSVSAMAVVSPGGVKYNDVYINRTSTGESSQTVEHVSVKEGNTLELVPGDSKLEFIGWNFYTPDMEEAEIGKDFEIISIKKSDGTDAVEGKDYTIKGGKIVAKDGIILNVTIKPLVDVLYVSENFKGVDIKFNISDTESLSPVTGIDVNYTVVAILGFMLLASATVAVVASKKAFNK